MSKASNLAESIMRQWQSGGGLDWRRARDDIHAAFDDPAATQADRVLCLAMHKSIMDAVERHHLVTDLAGFRKARRQD